MAEKSVEWKQVLKTGIAVGAIIFLIALLTGWLFAVIVVPTLIIILVLLAYFYLAPRNIFFTRVKDGTSIVIDKGDEIDHLLISWGGYIFKSTRDGKQGREEDNWTIVAGKDWHIFGGLRWIGFWPLYTVRTIEAEWSHYHPEVKDLVHHAEKQQSVWLRKDNYGTKFSDKLPAEDIDGVAVSATLIFPAQGFNPFLIASRQKYWFNLVEPIMAAVLRQFIARYRWKEDLLTMIAGKGIEEVQINKGIATPMKEGQDLREELWKMIKEEVTRNLSFENIKDVVVPNPDFGEELRIYGVAIFKMGATITNVDPGPEYRKAGTLKYVAEKEKEATIIRADAEAEAAKSKTKSRADQVGGLYVGINEELKKDSSMEEKTRRETATDLTVRDQAGQNGELKILDIRGVSDGLVAAAAIYGQFKEKNSASQKSVTQKSEERTTIIKEKTEEVGPKKNPSKPSSFTNRDGTTVSFDKKSGKGTITNREGKVTRVIDVAPE
ncbi:MAG: hypothetical protein E4H47_01265, partial [Parcubacteria group bacterium]